MKSIYIGYFPSESRIKLICGLYDDEEKEKIYKDYEKIMKNARNLLESNKDLDMIIK